MLSVGVIGQASKDDYKAIALQVAHHLGTAYPSWDPRSWSENDKDAYMVLKDLTIQDYRVVKKVYEQSYAKGHNLDVDLVKHLDSKYYNKLTFIKK